MQTASETTLEMIGKGGLSTQAYHMLRKALFDGHFMPGERLVMSQLAQQLGVSITPVREACLRLAAEHALEVISGRFVGVPKFDRTSYLNLRLIRMQLETLATALAAEKATAADVARLRAMIPAYAQASAHGPAMVANQQNRDFHFAVYQLCGIPLLVEQISNLWTLMGPLLAGLFRDSQRKHIGAEEHCAMIDAIERHDPEAAAEAVRRDLLRGGDDVLAYLDAMATAAG